MKYINLRSGMLLIADEGFTCIEPNSILKVSFDLEHEEFWVPCNHGLQGLGKHFLKSQTDDNGVLIGLKLHSIQNLAHK